MRLINAVNYQLMYSKLKDDKIPLKTAYKMNKLNTKLLPEIEFYHENILKILNEYAQKDEAGNFIQSEDLSSVILKPESIEECNTKILELQNMEIDAGETSFTLDELDHLQISPSDLQNLMPFIKE